MANIVLRQSLARPLTFTEADNNFNNLNEGKVEKPSTAVAGNLMEFDANRDSVDSGQTVTGLLDRSNHTGTQTLATISDAGSLAGLNQVPNESIGQAQIATGGVGTSEIANASITTAKFPTPVAGTAVKHWESIGTTWISNHGATSFVAQLTGAVTVRTSSTLTVALQVTDNLGTVVASGGGTNVTSINMAVVKGNRYFVYDNAGNPPNAAIIDAEVLTGNDTGIAAVI